MGARSAASNAARLRSHAQSSLTSLLPSTCRYGVAREKLSNAQLANAAPTPAPENASTSDWFSTSYMLMCMSSHAVSSIRESEQSVTGGKAGR